MRLPTNSPSAHPWDWIEREAPGLPEFLSFPLQELASALSRGDGPAAYCYLKDASELLLRVAHSIVLASALGPLPRAAVGEDHDVRASVAKGFCAGKGPTFGSLLHHTERLLERPALLGPEDTAGHRVAQALRSTLSAWRQLRDWRNHSFGHGACGDNEQSLGEARSSLPRLEVVSRALLPELRALSVPSAAGPAQVPGASLRPFVERLITTIEGKDGALSAKLLEYIEPGGRRVAFRDAQRGQKGYAKRGSLDWPELARIESLGHGEELDPRRRGGPLRDDGGHLGGYDGGWLSHLEAIAFAEFSEETYVEPTYLRDRIEAAFAGASSGYVRLTGPGGTGKSFLARGLVQRWRRAAGEGAAPMLVLPVFLLPHDGARVDWLSPRLEDAFPAETERLRRDWSVRSLRRPPSFRPSQASFCEWLDVLASNHGTLQRIVLVIDGVDELKPEASASTVTGLLPEQLPPGVFALVTGRPPSELSAVVEADLARLPWLAQVTLDPASAENRALVARWLKDKSGVAVERTSELLQRSEGRFLYASHEVRWARRIGRPLSREELYPAVLAWFEERLRGHPEYHRAVVQVLRTLALACEPVPVEVLLETGVRREFVEEALLDLRDLLARERVASTGLPGKAEPYTYRIFHRELQDHLLQAPDRRTFEQGFTARLLERREGGWADLDLSDATDLYTATYLGRHVDASFDDVVTLQPFAKEALDAADALGDRAVASAASGDPMMVRRLARGCVSIAAALAKNPALLEPLELHEDRGVEAAGLVRLAIAATEAGGVAADLLDRLTPAVAFTTCKIALARLLRLGDTRSAARVRAAAHGLRDTTVRVVAERLHDAPQLLEEFATLGEQVAEALPGSSARGPVAALLERFAGPQHATAFDQALAHTSSLVALHSLPPERLRERANAELEAGGEAWKAGDPATAEIAFKKARELLSIVTRHAPLSPELLRDLADLLEWEACVHERRSESLEALGGLGYAFQLRAELLARNGEGSLLEGLAETFEGDAPSTSQGDGAMSGERATFLRSLAGAPADPRETRDEQKMSDLYALAACLEQEARAHAVVGRARWAVLAYGAAAQILSHYYARSRAPEDEALDEEEEDESSQDAPDEDDLEVLSYLVELHGKQGTAALDAGDRPTARRAFARAREGRERLRTHAGDGQSQLRDLSRAFRAEGQATDDDPEEAARTFAQARAIDTLRMEKFGATPEILSDLVLSSSFEASALEGAGQLAPAATRLEVARELCKLHCSTLGEAKWARANLIVILGSELRLARRLERKKAEARLLQLIVEQGERALASHADSQFVLATVASAYLALGAAAREARDFAGALVTCRRSRELYQTLRDRGQDTPELLDELAQAHHVEGEAATELEDLQAAAGAFAGERLTHEERLARSDTDTRSVLVDLSIALDHGLHVATAQGDQPAATEACRRLVTTDERLLAEMLAAPEEFEEDVASRVMVPRLLRSFERFADLSRAAGDETAARDAEARGRDLRAEFPPGAEVESSLEPPTVDAPTRRGTPKKKERNAKPRPAPSASRTKPKGKKAKTGPGRTKSAGTEGGPGAATRSAAPRAQGKGPADAKKSRKRRPPGKA